MAAASVWRAVVCPFCALACDDLELEAGPGGLRVVAGGCPEGRARFEAPPPAAGAAIEGEPAPLAAAVARAAEILAGARRPLVAGLGADVAGVRAALALADRIGAVVDHLGSAGLGRDLRAIQDAGLRATTLSEVRARCDLLLVVGPDPAPALPRLVERCLDGEPPLGGGPRRIARLGPARAPGEPALAGDAVEVIVDGPDLPAAVAALRLLALLHPVPGPAGGLPLAGLQELARALRAASYAVVAWAPESLGVADGEPLVEALLGLARDLDRVTRCAGLALAGGDGLVGANQVGTWQTGVPLPVDLGPGGPLHDPLLASAAGLLARGEADALLWLSAFRAAPPPPTGAPAIVVGALAEEGPPPAVHLPAGVPGVDHPGQLFRLDAEVALPLQGPRGGGPPSAAALLDLIGEAIAAGAAAA